MGQAYSIDLRERVVAAVESGGLSCHRAAAQFGVGVSTAIRWVERLRNTGNVAGCEFCGYIAATHKVKKLPRRVAAAAKL
jgi:putative transposase